ncbi:hypothetical protein OC834_007958, partial [Tilletia horrida]
WLPSARLAPPPPLPLRTPVPQPQQPPRAHLRNTGPPALPPRRTLLRVPLPPPHLLRLLLLRSPLLPPRHLLPPSRPKTTLRGAARLRTTTKGRMAAWARRKMRQPAMPTPGPKKPQTWSM